MKLGSQGMSVADSSDAKTGERDTAHLGLKQSIMRGPWLRSWLSCWEIYPILLIAAALRFYRINLTE
ncbi:MAG TPA: hypothetical protein VHV10_04215, partial [Ktedonobacteraceae bacterium]|nr:hypothetical protein [Ktedonobacteraceae bacterium]